MATAAAVNDSDIELTPAAEMLYNNNMHNNITFYGLH
jgi:hypothetical protein